MKTKLQIFNFILIFISFHVSASENENLEKGIYYESISDYPNALKVLYQSKIETENNNDLATKITSYNYLGYVYWHMSKYDSAFYYHKKALEICNNNTQNEKAFTLLMLGNDHYDIGEFDKASSNYYKALKLSEDLKNISIQIQCHNRLSKLFFKLNDNKNSISHAKKAVSLNSNSEPRQLGDSYNSFGNIALKQQKTDSALFYFSKTLYYFIQSEDVIGQSVASINLGDSYFTKYNETNIESNLNSSYNYYQKSFVLNKKVDNQFGMIYGLWGMADVSLKTNNNNHALTNYRDALEIAKLIGAKSEQVRLFYKIHSLYDLQNNKDSSLMYLKKHLELKNIVENSNQTKKLMMQESKYEAEKLIHKEKLEIEKQRLIDEEKTKWKNILIYSIIGVAIVLGYILFVSLKRLKIIRNKNTIINSMNTELNIQKKDILDSINYAQRIQNAILPLDETISSHFKEHFIFYKPKDIVAGDFYWLESVAPTSNNKEEVVFFAVADCTGHGVPGAMMSVICKNILSNIIKEKEYLKPNLILNDTNKRLQETLESNSENIYDGMDISLISLNKSTNELSFSGAYNSLYIIRNKELIIFNGDRQPIGKFHKTPQAFTEHSFNVEKGDCIYLFTDGYLDQFGGDKNKKLNYARYRQLLLDISDLEMSIQKQKMEAHFTAWKQDNFQVDDVCVVGIRI